MTKVREIVQDAHIEIGVTDAEEAMEASKAAYALRVLNRMVQGWNTDELMVYSVNRNEYPLVAGQQSYTLGTGGDINVSRPVRIQMAAVKLPSGVEIPVDLINDAEWQGIALKSTPATFPTKLWIAGNMPLNTLYYWPVPQDGTVKQVLYTWQKQDNFASLDDDVIFPNGYEEALVTNLALNLSASYGVQPSPMLVRRAATSKSLIQSLNVDPLYMTTDFGSGSSIGIQSFGMVVDR